MCRLGLIVNPIAGMGGRVGLKGTDGAEILQRAKELGAEPHAHERAAEALKSFAQLKDEIELITCPGKMGEESALLAGLGPTLIGESADVTTSAEDTAKAARAMFDRDVKLILFAGGDGTARDIYEVVGDAQVVLGIPAGVKIHSAVYACNPIVAGDVAASYIRGEIKRVLEAEVMDIDEDAFREQRLSAQLYGYLKIPYRRNSLQRLKLASNPNESHSQEAIAFDIVENMSDDFLYIIGPGTTTRAIMQKLGLEYSLLGIDVVCEKKLIGKDCNEVQLLEEIRDKKTKLIITPVGGQGFILGRGNQQLSPEVIRCVGKENIIIAATEGKLASFKGEPLMVDTGEQAVDKYLSGYYRVVTGYHSSSIYPVSSLI